MNGSDETFSAQIIFDSNYALVTSARNVICGVPLCLHEENAGSEWNPDVILTINDHLITIHHEQPMDSSMISNQECEANALCQASFSTVITSAFSAAIPSDSFSYAISLITKPISFIPEQPQRPPLA